MKGVRKFFKRYEEANNAVDAEAFAAFYAGEFLACGPFGVVAGRNDEKLREAMRERQEFLRGIGLREASVLDVEKDDIDDRFASARVRWRLRFERIAGDRTDVEFEITYLLYDDGSGPRIASWIAHDDERALLKEAGVMEK